MLGKIRYITSNHWIKRERRVIPVEEDVKCADSNDDFICHIDDHKVGHKNCYSVCSYMKDMEFLQRMRRIIIRVVDSPNSHFDSVILLIIILNSISMACTDYTHVNEKYEPTSTDSNMNAFVENMEILFLVVFLVECILKIITYGFFMHQNSYLRRDGWNVLDFVVVVASLLGMFPSLPNLSSFRMIRVLRPLRSISKLPGLRKIVSTLFESMKSLANVIFLLIFLLALFSIVGTMFWKGLLHFRCRLTPFPVRLTSSCRNENEPCWDKYLAAVIEHPERFKCLPVDNDNEQWTQQTSPWFEYGPQDCFWPIDYDDERVCSNNGIGEHICLSKSWNSVIRNRTCGSHFDKFGNPRFIDNLEPYGFSRMQYATFAESLNYGFTNYDDFLNSFVTTFQVVSLEGWTGILYNIIDSWGAAPAIIIFTISIVLTSQIALNLVLAVITDSMEKLEEGVKRNEEQEVEKSIPVIDTHKSEHLELQKINEWSRNLIESKIFKDMVMVCITINTIVLSCDHYGISERFQSILGLFNAVLTFIFFLEMCLSIHALGLKKYLSDLASVFDMMIVIVSLLELAISFGDSEEETSSGFSALRALRLFRIFKMAKNWRSLHALLHTMYETLKEVGNFTLLLVLVIYIYALIGMQLFANRMHFDKNRGFVVGIVEEGYSLAEVPRSNFDSLPWAMTTVFQILTGENWNSIMYDGRRATSAWAILYFFTLVVFGVFIVMNLFLAILLGNFEGNEELTKNEPKRWNQALGVIRAGLIRKKYKVSPLKVNDTEFFENKCEKLDIERTLQSCTVNERSNRVFSVLELTKMRFHQLSSQLVCDSRFDVIMTIFIVINSFCVALDSPLDDPNSFKTQVLASLDFIFALIFLSEMIFKVEAYGFFTGKDAYIKNAWNTLDATVVLVSILDVVGVGPGKALRALRTLRVLRPLRMIRRFPELKLVVDALLKSLPSVGNVAIISTHFFLVFAIFGVNYLKGTFYACNEDKLELLTADQIKYLTYPSPWGDLRDDQKAWFNSSGELCMWKNWTNRYIPSSKEICDCFIPGAWAPVIPQNFDNVVNAMSTLFEIATTEGWVDVMLAAVDQRGIHNQPVRDNNLLWIPFFILFLIVGAFFVLELFVGVIIEQFNNIRNKNGRVLMTKAQQEWAATQAFIMRMKPGKRVKRPSNKLRSWCYDFIMPSKNPKFEQIILVMILINTICMGITRFGEPQFVTNTLELCNDIFSVVFITEALLKIIALEKRYFDDRWNLFDFVIVAAASVCQIMSLFAENISSFVPVMNLFRICRLFRLVKSLKRLRLVFNTLVTSIPSMVNVGALLLLLYFIYAACGVQLFSIIALNDVMNDQANFRSFGNAMLLLLRFSTGENWNGFMRSMTINSENCESAPVFNPSLPWCEAGQNSMHCTEINGCGQVLPVYLYFYSFTLIVSFVILNLFVGVVLDAFRNSVEGDILSPNDLEKFTNVWADYDPDATWYINATDLKHLIIKLEPPLGFHNMNDCGFDKFEDTLRETDLGDIPVNKDGKVNIVHVATHLAKRVVKLKQGNAFYDVVDEEIPYNDSNGRISTNIESSCTLKDVFNTRIFMKQVKQIVDD